MTLIWFLLRASWLNVSLAIITGLISGGCSAQLLAKINSSLNNGGSSTNDLFYSFAGLAVITLITSIISQYLLVKLSQNAIYKLRLRLSNWILSCPLRHVEELGANKLLATLTEDVDAVSSTVFALPFLCIDIALVLGCLIYLGSLSWIVFLVTFVFLVVAILSVQWLIHKGEGFFKLAREKQDRLFQNFRDITDGIKELKLDSQRRLAFVEEELEPTAAASRDYKITSLSIFSLATGWGQLLFFTLVGLLLFGLPKVVPVSSLILSGYVLTITYLMRPLQSLLEILPTLTRASVSLQKIDALGLSLASRAENNANFGQAVVSENKVLELIDVTHAYKGEKEEHNFTLGPISLRFQSGEVIFLVGGNGSGKSTLAKLITGLYIPEGGKICLNGVVIDENNREWYRQHFSVVFADFYLFERLLGFKNPELDRVAREYLKQLEIDHKVEVKNGVLSTTALSQGQRKRLALLNAYLADRPFYLFDEWASDQDPYFKEIFYKQILLELKQRNKTVIVISHDDRYFNLADRIIKLDYGKLEYDKLSGG